VHVGEEVEPAGWQAPHEREEALVGGVLAQPAVEVQEPRLVVRPDGTDAEIGAVPQDDRPLELARIHAGRSRGPDLASDPFAHVALQTSEPLDGGTGSQDAAAVLHPCAASSAIPGGAAQPMRQPTLVMTT